MATVPIDSHSNHDERRPFFTSRQLADYLALSERTVRELLRTGAIPSYKVSGARRIDPADVDIWLAGCREEGKAACVSTERHRCRESTPPGPSCGSRATRTPLVTARATFKRKRDAQAAIDAAYGRAERIENVGGYFQRWPRFHPRTERTQRTNEHRITRALDIELDGVPLRVWAYTDLRRRHALALIDVLLTEQGRSALGATHIIRALSVMTEDAITDEVAEVDPFKGVAVRANAPRVSKRPRPVRVFTFEQMHAFARAGGSYEPMLRTFTDTGMRLGEVRR